MLQTDLDGFIMNMKNNKIVQLGLIILGCVLLYCLLSNYLQTDKNAFANVMVITGSPGNGNMNNINCRGDIPKIDEVIIKDSINLPDRDPRFLTNSMVIPEITTSQETQKQTRMEVLNMFYNTFDDDLTSVKARPQGLYLTP
jgi:hypothetical protein